MTAEMHTSGQQTSSQEAMLLRPRRTIRAWVWWLVVLTVWSVPAVMEMASRMYVPESPHATQAWYEIFGQQAPVWYLWAALTPLLIYLARRFPIEGSHIRRNLVVHAGLSVVIGMSHFFLSFLLRGLILGHNFHAPEYHNFFLFMLRYTTHIHILVYWATIGVIHAFHFYRKYRDRELVSSQLRAELMASQVSVLRMQIQPHFLFNTLHTISNLMREGDRDRALKMIADLSRLLRRSLETFGRSTHTIDEELSFTRMYLDIMRTRFAEQLTVTINETPEIAEIQMPVFLLQPIVENAFKHGLDRTTEGGRLVIDAGLDGESVVIRVFNNGPSLADGQNWSVHTGAGLRNTMQRLEALYSSAASLTLKNVETGGVEAVVRFPRTTVSSAGSE